MVQAHYEAIKRRDLTGILQTIAEDVIWEFPAPAIVPFSGLFEGLGTVRDFFVAVGSSVYVREFAVERIFVENETAITLGRERFAVKATHQE
ncbi:nuclear transport factor 2 family protein [Pelagibius sp. Alg239-R121]|uniref:nuclear transport factor 2 family protein n=1 Tax=Pelagibius sp. Alg239-R121 TaxID=2993448 RepID=UPI00345FE7B3